MLKTEYVGLPSSKAQINNFKTRLETSKEIGFVTMVEHPLVRVEGLPTVTPKEVVEFETGQIGQVLSLNNEFVEVLLFSNKFVAIGTRVAKTNDLLKVPVGNELLGHILDPLGRSLQSFKPLKTLSKYSAVDVVASGINLRKEITKPLETGVTVVDLLVPLGRGQRELVIGDRGTGKSQFLLQTMLCQAKKGSVCIWAGIGKRKEDIKEIESFIATKKITGSTLVVASNSYDPLGLIYLTPYSAMTFAEYFRDAGYDVLLILDDLTTHAKFYREISLLGRRFPGRSSYPGDIFYTHSRLLERAGNFVTKKGIFSITCLTSADTIEGDISGYIQTNLMSITDGHIYFDKNIFTQGRRPAVNYFLSVTRVGRQTQSKLRWSVNSELTKVLTLLEKAEHFVHFGAELSDKIKNILIAGSNILSFLNQPMNKIVPINLQIVLLGFIWLGLIKTIQVEINMKYIVSKAILQYNSKPEFKALIDKMVVTSDCFGVLLKKVREKAQEISTFLRMSG